MEISVEGGKLIPMFSISYKDKMANKYLPLTSRLWLSIIVKGNLWQEALIVVLKVIFSIVTLPIELVIYAVIAAGLLIFYTIYGIGIVTFWLTKELLTILFGSVKKGLIVLFQALSLFIVFYLIYSGTWRILYGYLERFFSFLEHLAF